MRILLDTHVLIWALEDNPRLSPEAKEIIKDDNNDIYVSVMSLMEISIKHKKSPTIMPFTGKEICNYSLRAGYRLLAISAEDMNCFDEYDFKGHKDPFDCMLVAQSYSGNLKLMTHDSIIKGIAGKSTIYF